MQTISHTHHQKMYAAAQRIDELICDLSGAHCEYRVMDAAYVQTMTFPELTVDNRGNRLFVGDQYMVITCANACKYYVNVTADSVLAACAEVFGFIQHRL